MSAVRRIVLWCRGADNKFEQVLAEIHTQLRAASGGIQLASREEWTSLMADMIENIGATPQFTLDDGRIMVHSPTVVDTKDIEDLLKYSSPLCNPNR